MTEAVMLAALGFLVATLLWLMLLPAVGRRADRLARRRAELSFPISMDEVAAERDHLRAEHAVKLREAERRAEDSLAQRALALQSVGALDMQIAELKTTIAVRDMAIVDLSGTIDETRAVLENTEALLAAERDAHARALQDIAVLQQALAERDKEIGDLRIERADLSAALAGRERDLVAANSRGDGLDEALGALRSEFAALSSAHGVLGSERDRLAAELASSVALASARGNEIAALTVEVTSLGNRLAQEQSGHQTTRAVLDQRGTELVATISERDSLRQRLKASDDALAAQDIMLNEARAARATSDTKYAALRKDVDQQGMAIRDAIASRARLEAEAASVKRALEARLEMMEADLAERTGRVSALRAERAALAADLADARREAERSQLRIEAETGQLRGEIQRIADQFLAARGRLPTTSTLEPHVPRRDGLPARDIGGQAAE